jgi:plasmid stabilization system protein ParE
VKRPARWSRSALDDLKQQIIHIAADDPVAAQRIVERIRDAGIVLGEIPTGRPGRVVGTYEKSVSRVPYIIAYAIGAAGEGEVISILRVIHTARDWPPNTWPEP